MKTKNIENKIILYYYIYNVINFHYLLIILYSIYLIYVI